MKKIKWLLVVLFLTLIVVTWVIWSNIALEITKIKIEDINMPYTLDGFKIVQISDLHNYEYGKNNEKLIENVKKEKPNIIAITGDFIDYQGQKKDVALYVAQKCVEIAPTFYITGNHESGIYNYDDFMNKLRDVGVEILDNRLIEFPYNNTYINVVGILDPSDGFYGYDYGEITFNRLEKAMEGKKDYYTILLTHRPEYYEVYKQFPINLVLSGHTHGGQFRLPFVGGVLGHNKVLFPKYDAGLFIENGVYMMISRGLGSSFRVPIRINNRPELVVIELIQ